MKKGFFKDAIVQDQFDRDGFVVIDFISPADAGYIAEKFYELHPDLPKGFYAAAFSSDDKLKQEIFDRTQAVFEKVVDETFVDYKILGSTFLCKAPGEEGKVGVHQDWLVVDESVYSTATIWVPTADTTAKNGTLMVLPGSHLFMKTFRSPNIPFFYKGNEELIWDNMITVPLKAGQAFVLNHAVIHASAANTSTKERLVIAYALTHKDADLMFYHKELSETTNTIEKYKMPDDFFQRYYNIGQRPEFGSVAEKFDSLPNIASKAELVKLINRERVNSNLPEIALAEEKVLKQKERDLTLFEKLKNLFS